MNALTPDSRRERARSPACGARSRTCTPNWSATAWWSGPAGNVSGRVPGTDLFVIKPSGVELRRARRRRTRSSATWTATVVDGTPGSERSPSSDTAAHAYVYRHMPRGRAGWCTPTPLRHRLGGPRRAIPCVLTAMADEFGGEIPVGPFAIIGDDSIGRGIVETLAGHRSRAVLMHSHGPFTIGKDARDAVKAAVMLRGRGPHRAPLPPARRAAAHRPAAHIDSLFDRYQNVYGQQPATVRAQEPTSDRIPPPWTIRGLVPHRQPGPLRRGHPAPGGRAVPARSSACSTRPGCPVEVVWKPTLKDARRRSAARRSRPTPTDGLIGVDRLDAHLQPRQDVDRRPRRAAQAAAAPAHPDQRRAAVGRDRLRLHEPQPGRPRRPRVRLHPDPARGAAQDRGRARLRPRGVTAQIASWRALPPAGRLSRSSGWPASATTCATSPSPRATRRRPSSGSASPSTPGASTTSSAVVDAQSEADVDELVAEYEEPTTSPPSCGAAGSVTSPCATAPGRSSGCAPSSRRAASARSPRTSRTSAGCASCPGLAVQRLMARGYGFGAEGDWKTALLVRAAKVMGAGLPGGASLMEDYTYHLVPGEEKILGAHMLEICPSADHVAAPPSRCTRWASAAREDPVRLVFDTDAGDGVVVAMSDMRDRFRLTANAVDVVPPDAPLPEPAGGPRRLGAAARLRDLGRGLAHRRRGPPHGADHRGGAGGVRGLRRHRRHRAARSSTTPPPAGVPARAALERGLPPARAEALSRTHRDGRNTMMTRTTDDHHDVAPAPISLEAHDYRAVRPGPTKGTTMTLKKTLAGVDRPDPRPGTDGLRRQPRRRRRGGLQRGRPDRRGDADPAVRALDRRRRERQGAARGARLRGGPAVRQRRHPHPDLADRQDDQRRGARP